MWNEVLNRHKTIGDTIDSYNLRICNEKYIEHPDILECNVYYDFVTAHLISLLIKNSQLYVPIDIFRELKINKSLVGDLVDWVEENDKIYVNARDNVQTEIIEKELMNECFSEKRKMFIQEICAQDIIANGTLAKDIYSIMGSIYTTAEIDAFGEDVIIQRFLSARENGMSVINHTRIEDKYRFEYINCARLMRNRVFKHDNRGFELLEKVNLVTTGEEVLDYRFVKNFCQTAIIHIGVEETGSVGTGFLISEDGYALTCAHVVENAKHVYATIITGDGYANEYSREGFEVYDAGDGEVVYVNHELDIALIKMEHYGTGFLPIENRMVLPELGDEVVVFGYPLGYEMPQSNFFGPNMSFYRGYVSSNQINKGNSMTFLDIDVKSGNSGSPVISTKTGKVIGILSGVKLGGKRGLVEKMPYMVPIQHFIKLNDSIK